ncbi:MAG: PIN domain-containing protein [candidate division NC10 bacterium]
MAVYVTDTHPLIWHQTDDPNLSAAARKILDETDQGRHTVWIPAIVLVEIIYISEKHRIPPEVVSSFLSKLPASTNYLVAPLDMDTIIAMRGIPRPAITDMPDRIITATAMKLGVPLITLDPRIKESSLVSVVW